jgi:hypothetical protein
VYEYDIFLSYRRVPPVSDWVHTHFQERLTEWLGETLAHQPRVFVDRTAVDTGDDWPMKLRQALLTSQLLVAVWSPSYFRSKWCMAEFHSMLERERMLGLPSAAQPWRLIMPVRYHDGKLFPGETRQIQMRDFRAYNVPVASFQDTRDYPEFIRAMQEFAEEIAERLAGVPDWQPDWPVTLPPTDPGYDIPIPRL